MIWAGVRWGRRRFWSSSLLRYRSTRTSSAQGRLAQGKRTSTARATPLWPYRQAVYPWLERTGSRCRALPLNFPSGLTIDGIVANEDDRLIGGDQGQDEAAELTGQWEGGPLGGGKDPLVGRAMPLGMGAAVRRMLATVRRPVVRIAEPKGVTKRCQVGRMKTGARA